MAAVPEFMPSTMSSNMIANAHISSDHDTIMKEHGSPVSAAGPLSSPQPSLSQRTSASLSPSDSPSPESARQDIVMSDSGSDVDAEGSEDDEYAQIQNQSSALVKLNDPPTDSSSTSSGASRKRKTSIDEEEFMRTNPELYGLRRSGRARHSRAIVETTSEDGSDSDIIRPRVKRRRQNGVSASHSKPPTPPSISQDSDSDSDNFLTNVRHKPSKKQKRHLKNVAAGLAPPSQSHQRFSTRSGRKVANYNEADNDSFDEDFDELDPSQWAAEEEDTSPFIGAVLAYRLAEGSTMTQKTLDKSDFDYWIKWQDKAHIHATWEVYEDIKNLRGFRRLDNYYRKMVEPLIELEREGNVDDKEAFALKYEQAVDEYHLNQEVERVISVREGDEETEYYVKWKRVNYDGCTWETASFVGTLAQSEIDKFLDRSQRLPTSDKKLSNINSKQSYKPWAAQPDYVTGGTLRDFQVMGVNFLAMNWCRQRNVILADEMGLGKTVQTVSFTNWMMHEMKQEGPFLIVVPLGVIPAWLDTYQLWAPDMNVVVYTGNAASRQIIKDHELLLNGDVRKTRVNVVLTTYEIVLAEGSFLSQIKWQFLAVDEAHRLKNRESQLYGVLFNFNVPNRLLITGTPMQNSLEELRALLDFLNPGDITAPDNFDSLPPEEAAIVLSEFKEAIRPYMLRRVKEEVEKDLPPKTEKIIRVELAQLQIEYYQNIITRNYAALNEGAHGHKASLLNIMMELKKVSNHPFVFHGAEDRVLRGSTNRDDVLRAIVTSSGKMMLLDKLLAKMRKDGHRVLIFCQLCSMLDILSDYCQLRGYTYQRLDGGVPSNTRRQSIEHFNAPGSDDFVFLLSTRAGGLGINLMTADTVVLFDSDWNPHPDLQAMARAHRIGQTKPVTVYRFVSADTIEEEILERARNKLMLEFLTIQSGMVDKEQENTIKKHAQLVEQPRSAEDITEILKRRSQKMFEQNDNQKKLEELDIDVMLETAEEHQTKDVQAIQTSDGGIDFMKSLIITNVKFDGNWDDIIPKEQLEALQAEEQKRQEEETLRKLQEEHNPRKRSRPQGLEDKTQRAAKKKAKKNAAAMAAAEEDDSDSDAKDKDSDDENNDPKAPLTQSQVRRLVKGIEHYGFFNDADIQGKILHEFRLEGKDLAVLQAEYDEIIGRCHEEMALQRSEEQKMLTKKQLKSVTFTHKGVKRINAETVLDRIEDMRMVRTVVAEAADIEKFRLPEASKGAQYTCEWGSREDGMLIVGIARHGFGGWTAIRDDEELGLKDKMFLEENRQDIKNARVQAGKDAKPRSPGAVHLVRRGEYLVSVLQHRVSNGTNAAARKALENHHRNTKKAATKDRVQSLAKSNGTPVGSPVPNGSLPVRKGKKERKRTNSHLGAQPSIERPASREGSTKPTKRTNGHDEDGKSKRRNISTDSHSDSRRPVADAADKEKILKEKARHQNERDRRRVQNERRRPDSRQDAYSARREPRARDNVYSERRWERDGRGRDSRERSTRSRSRSRSPHRQGHRNEYHDRYEDRYDDRRGNRYDERRDRSYDRRDDRRDDRRGNHYDRDDRRDSRRHQDDHRSYDRHDRPRSRNSSELPRRQHNERPDDRRPKSDHPTKDARERHKERHGETPKRKHVDNGIVSQSNGSSSRSRCMKRFDEDKFLIQNLRKAVEMPKTDSNREEKALAMRSSMAAVGKFIMKVVSNGKDGSSPTSEDFWSYIAADVFKNNAPREALERVANKAIAAQEHQ